MFQTPARAPSTTCGANPTGRERCDRPHQLAAVFAPSADPPGRPFTTRKLDSVAVRAALDTRLSILRCARPPRYQKAKRT